MGIKRDLAEDLKFIQRSHRMTPLRICLTNRGFHALLVYRLCHYLHRHGMDLLPMVMTRLVQIIYSMDIDFRAEIEGGIVIRHGFGLAIGETAKIGRGTELYHGVTVGIRGFGEGDESPKIGRYCVLGTGCKILGSITVGDHCVIGANVVLTTSVPDRTLVKLPDPVVRPRNSVPDQEHS